MKAFEQFTNLYPLSKTLRAKLIPIGKTMENFINSGFLDNDIHRAESYKKVKKIIDRYHKAFIEQTLCNFEIKYSDDGTKDSLSEYYLYYHLNSKDETRTESLKTIQDNLRKQISIHLKSTEVYKRINKKELIKEDLPNFVDTQEDKELVNEFKDFTTYFTGFYENRENMYTAEEKSTSIAYRLIHQNLPKFIDNMDTFEKLLSTPIGTQLEKLYNDFESYLNVNSVNELFELKSFNMLLTQSQIAVYNAIIGGKALENGEKIQGLNEYINLYNQVHEKADTLPKLKLLYKQILSDREAISFLPEEFKDDSSMLESIQNFYLSISAYIDSRQSSRSLIDLLSNIKDYDLNKIYIANDLQLTDISQKLFGNWNVIQNAIRTELRNHASMKKKESLEQYEDRISKLVKSANSFSIAYLNDCIKSIGGQKHVEDYFIDLGAVNTDTIQKESIFSQIANSYTDVKDLLTNNYSEDKDLAQENNDVERIKTFLDCLKDLQHFIKPLLGNGDEPEKDELFYGEFSMIWDELDALTPLYNKVRNRMTRKPYSTEKIKLNFESSQLLNGWDVNKEHDNLCTIFERGGLYYIGIINKKYNKIFDNIAPNNEDEYYNKMEYKLLPGANKMLPKVFFSDSRIRQFNPSEDLLDKYQKGTHKKGASFNIDDCRNLIDFFKSSINKHEDWKNFNFKFSDTKTYQDISGFYREVEQQGYKISFKKIPCSYINNLVEEGKLFLFQIYNKDFSTYSKGTPNMHTLYWKELFDPKNLKDVVYKLNGQAEIFYRKSSIKDDNRVIHPANHAIENKNVETIKRKKTSTFSYDIIKDRRYTVDGFQFHVPITINFKSNGSDNINLKVNQYLKDNKDIHIIGIDRGERHLLYLTLIDLKGNIIKQFTLNDIINDYQGTSFKTNYHDLLSLREEERMKARKSWKTIENIKELKEGYLSQVVHTICNLVIEYNAIVVLEDLNRGFVRGRQKVEKQVYQKFEKMLIDKLNYLVDKRKDPSELGGLLNAYQLTSKLDSFQKLGKQSGILFYIPAWNTSKMDPSTGFVNLFESPHYESIEKSKAFFCKFDSIKYNSANDWFELAFDYNKFTTRAEGSRNKWTLCTGGSRIKTFRDPKQNNQWNSVEIQLTDEFRGLFREYNIDINGNLKEQICQKSEKNFFENLYSLFHLTLQLRNSITGSEVDYLISPVADNKGKFFDSRTCDESLPKNADANGAFNIARKGLWVLQNINESKDMSKFKLPVMTNKEWLNYAQTKSYLKANE